MRLGLGPAHLRPLDVGLQRRWLSLWLESFGFHFRPPPCGTKATLRIYAGSTFTPVDQMIIQILPEIRRSGIDFMIARVYEGTSLLTRLSNRSRLGARFWAW
ncbi:hypothetical protein SBA6_90008 [Candidatus Sulfopaludibacter sp. SbA6]|nr:hypothetical protein SBA6_90008 [Candidatus Sulfopaludibacter sp. SbA6]